MQIKGRLKIENILSKIVLISFAIFFIQGITQAQSAELSFDTIDTGYKYRLTNSFLNDERSLDVFSNTNALFMGETSKGYGQEWVFRSLGNNKYSINDAYGRVLDVNTGLDKPFMNVWGNYAGQVWTIIRQSNGYYRITDAYGRALDTYGNGENDPMMGEFGNFSGQLWKLTKISKLNSPTPKNIEGNWAGYFKDGRKSTFIWAIRQSGSTFTIEEIGTSQRRKSAGQINGDRIFATDFGTQGTLSADGKEISWTDGVVWVRQPVIMASSDKSKQLPASLFKYMDSRFKGWDISPESELCGEKLLYGSGDFDGDGKKDYAVYFVLNKDTSNARLLLYAFLDRGKNFQPFKISENKDAESFGFTSFSIVKKGTKLQTGERRNDFVTLQADAITEYTCETDASSTYLYKSGKFSVMNLFSP